MDQIEEPIELYSKTTKDVEVVISPRFIEPESNLEQGVYAHAYTVTLRNHSRRTVQLINRHWIVMSAGRQIADVKGEGVVGEQPILHPGESYQYTSWTVIKDSVGAMHGVYTFYAETGEFFDVEIPRFNLIYADPTSIH